DICTIQISPQLSRVNVFVDPQEEIESAMLLPAVKGHKYKGEKVTNQVIFPYKTVTEYDIFGTSSKTVGMTENELKNFPLAYKYLQKHKEDLSNRSIHNSLWFHYGRTQGLQTVFQQKLSLSPVIHWKNQSCKAYFV